MTTINIVRETRVSRSARARQLESLFDVPATEKCRVEWQGEFPYDTAPWHVGLIVGPSGCGKSTVLREVFGETAELTWTGASVVDDFASTISIRDVSEACQAVGFNTIPAWLRPYAVLSNGERFRVEMARRILETDGTIVVDEFTSVVDRQVAQIGSHAIQKFVRRTDKRFVAASCHYDIIDWLQPDWVLEPATMRFQRRSLQRRPSVECTIARIPRTAWRVFAPYHYMSAHLHKGAKTWGIWANETLAGIVATLPMPISAAGAKQNLERISRVVTLPDWQGLGLAMILVGKLGAAFRGVGRRLRNYPAHPAFVRSHAKSPEWRMVVAPGAHNNARSGKNGFRAKGATTVGGRPCAVFEYVGAALPERDARLLLQM
ncbi:MAG: hypothetical protein LUO79_02930 [Methanomassiliicoccales archaeon]|nr:hypothetical protein [Methanomassiliicoccales archaeon]